MKKTLLSICLACTVFGTASTAVDANVIGGWSEEEGYFTNDRSSMMGEFATHVFKSDPIHKGYKQNRQVVGSQPYERVVGETTWTGVYHYTRARYEKWVTNRPEADSGQVFGSNRTKAISGWHPGDFATAKTYYGKEK